jgi:hypothetical protein
MMVTVGGENAVSDSNNKAGGDVSRIGKTKLPAATQIGEYGFKSE